MALASRNSENIFNKNTGGDKDGKTIDSAVETEIKAKFDNGDHISDQGMFENLSPALYAIQQLADDVEELRRYIVALAPDEKPLPTISTASHTVDFTVTNSRGAYALVTTVVDNSSGKAVTKTVTTNLR
mgnify:FL=1